MSSSTAYGTQSKPQLPWKLRLLLRLVNFLLDFSLRSDITINRWLGRVLDRKVPPSPDKPVDGAFSADFIIDTSRDLWIRIFTPVHGGDTPNLPVIIFYHGGGFALSYADSQSVDIAARRLALELGAVVVSVNYRLAPEHRFPCQYEDGFDALKFIDRADEGVLPENADRSRCFIVGESAGGNLGHHVAVKASEYEFRKVKVVGLIATQPFFGGEERTEAEIRLCRQPPLSLRTADWFWKAFLPDGSDRDHPAANVFARTGIEICGRKFPATVIFVGGLDPLQEWQRRYYEGLKRCGNDANLVEYPNAVHGFFGFPELPEYALMITAIRDFMAKQAN